MTKSVRLAIAQAVYFSIFIVFTVLGITATLLALLLLIGGSGLVETVFLGDEPVYLDELRVYVVRRRVWRGFRRLGRASCCIDTFPKDRDFERGRLKKIGGVVYALRDQV